MALRSFRAGGRVRSTDEPTRNRRTAACVDASDLVSAHTVVRRVRDISLNMILKNGMRIAGKVYHIADFL
jgi:hypothetical protein